MTRAEYAAELGVCLATVDNYIRAVRGNGKRVTLATLRAHQRTLVPGPAPDVERATQIRRMRDRKRDPMTWEAIGAVFGFSGSRACAIYRSASLR
jgi:phage terminase large subunit GpA-like protein